MSKSVVHFEIGCNNLTETSAFYEKVFNWKTTPAGRSAAIETGDTNSLPGHLTQLDPDEPQQYITIYIETDTLEEDLKAVVAHGGERMVDPIELPDGRTFAWIKDVAGNIVGLITPHVQS